MSTLNHCWSTLCTFQREVEAWRYPVASEIWSSRDRPTQPSRLLGKTALNNGITIKYAVSPLQRFYITSDQTHKFKLAMIVNFKVTYQCIPSGFRSLDLEKKILKFDLDIPRLRIDAVYNLKGNILLLPLLGSGNVAMTMKDVKSSVYTKISIKGKPEVNIMCKFTFWSAVSLFFVQHKCCLYLYWKLLPIFRWLHVFLSFLSLTYWKRWLWNFDK